MVFANYDGARVRIKAVFSGMQLNQYRIGRNGELIISENRFSTVDLCEMRYDELLKLSYKNNGKPLSPIEILEGRTKITDILSLVANVLLKSILESYCSLHDIDIEGKSFQYELKNLNVFKNSNKSYNSSLKQSKLSEAIDNHQKFIKMQKNRLNKKRVITTRVMKSLKDNEEKFSQELDGIIKMIKKPTVLVFGNVGVGKTTLIQNIMGKEIVDGGDIMHYKRGTEGFKLYQNDYINILDSMGFEPGMDTLNFIKEMKEKIKETQIENEVHNHIHLTWYCIQGSGGRVTENDLYMIKNILSIERTLVVLTKSDISKKEQLDGMTEFLIENGIPSDKILTVNEQERNSRIGNFW